MPAQSAVQRARQDAREGKSASTQAGEFIREEIHRIREGEHGARSTKQAIAIGLSEARRAGVKLPPPAEGKAPEALRKKAKQDLARAKSPKPPSRKRAAAALKALRKEPTRAASHDALSRHAKAAARQRGHADLVRAGEKAAQTRRRRGT